ncbi:MULTISPECIES: protease modulator HflC [unclassified Thiomonas]|uniref:protease modulator HflC n=1 Tax=unclassified Thiomonas TaxID=2625466 RepID=UPI0004DBB3A4|nr:MULTISPECIES: protease modulator HflC [unclassified Thiomonas]MDD5001998.1 protease modulator HflC [Thiomonas arsenitoxydans]CDW96051.1 Protein hflC [Thiomonas sp. CB2]VDY06974.1 Protein HflC [Thiomonas sp. Bio17B3]VDY09730.1 Protein HflC [Thiomonas sp. Sup16B3]VDY15248.1 Protein hflC [Thiomonas sp. OC7]
MNKIILALVALVVAILLLSSSLFVVDQRQFAAVFGLGQIKRVISTPGLYFKIPAPFENVVFLDKRILTLQSPDTDRFITAEKKNVVVDWYLKWRITNPTEFIRSYGGDQRRAGDRLAQIVKAALNEQITRRTVREVLSSQRDQVMQDVQTGIAKDINGTGIQIVDMRLTRVDFVSAITQSVYRRMEAERQRVANELRSTGYAEAEKIRAEADKQREIVISQAYSKAQTIKGQGDAEASSIYAKSFGQNPQFAEFYRSLEAYRASFNSKSDVLVLDPNSQFFQFFRGPGGAALKPGK